MHYQSSTWIPSDVTGSFYIGFIPNHVIGSWRDNWLNSMGIHALYTSDVTGSLWIDTLYPSDVIGSLFICRPNS